MGAFNKILVICKRGQSLVSLPHNSHADAERVFPLTDFIILDQPATQATSPPRSPTPRYPYTCFLALLSCSTGGASTSLFHGRLRSLSGLGCISSQLFPTYHPRTKQHQLCLPRALAELHLDQLTPEYRQQAPCTAKAKADKVCMPGKADRTPCRRG